MKKFIFVLIFASIGPRLFAQDPSGDVPNDPSTAMTVESSDPISNSDDGANNTDVSSDFTPPDNPTVGGDYEGPVGVTGIFNGNVTTACSYDPLGHSAHRAVDDIVVPGSVGKYPLKLTRYYNSRSQWYLGQALGTGWEHEYSWFQGSGGKLISPQGNVYDPFCGQPVGVSETWEGNDWRLADGGRVHFDGTTGRAAYIEDPYGLRTTIEYSDHQVWRVTEPGGRCLVYSYGPDIDPNGTILLHTVEAYDYYNGHRIDWVTYSYTLVSAGVRGRNRMMLTGVAYSDGTSATYLYRNDNVHESPYSPPYTFKMNPLLQRADDVRYSGAMRTIWYDYQNGPHGAIARESYPGVGPVSAIAPAVNFVSSPETFTETRGDGASRTFTYTRLSHCHGEDCGPCEDYWNNDAWPDQAPQQMLTNYTDFQEHTTTLGYDANWYINSVRDANNHTTTYERGLAPPAGIGEIKKITHPDGTYIQYIYGSDPHYVMSIRDERGNWTVHTRDARHLITRTDYKDANNNVLASEDFTYNSFGQVLTHRLKNGAYQHFQYDNRGLLLAKTNPTDTADWQTALNSPAKTTYSYWSNAVWTDRVFRMTLPRNGSNQTASERYEYDRNPQGAAVPGRGLVTKIRHADGTYQSFGYTQFGNKIWEENELRQRTTYTYDNYNRLLSVTNPLNKTETFSYLKPGTTSPYLHTTNSVYTDTSRAGIVTTNLYDQNWRKTLSTVGSTTTHFAYDNLGNLTDVTDPRTKVTHNEYDNRNRKTTTTEAYGIQGLAATTVWHYNPVGSIVKIDRPDGQSETKGYDPLNRVTWHTVPRQVIGGGQVNVTTRFDYNPSGTILRVIDPNGHRTAFLYDPSDRKTRMTYPDNSYQSWAYDDAGNLNRRTTVHGGTEVQHFEYDNRNRKINMSWDNGADSANYGYDDASRLTSANNPNSNVTRVYDAAGRLTHDQQQVIGLGIKDVSYPQYDDDGRVTRLSVAGVYDYTFGYDAMGRFETISTGGSLKFRYVYDPASNETDRYAYFNGNTIDQIYGRDSLDRMSSRVLKKNGATIAGTSEAYTYDHMNRLRQVNRGGVADSFAYYWTGELLSADYGGEPDLPYNEGQDPDLDTADTVDLNAGYRPPETAEAEPPPPPDDTTPPDSTADTTPSPESTPPSDTPPAEDSTKGQKTVDDYLGDGKQGPEGPAPDLPTGRSVRYTLDKAGNRTSVTDNANGNATYEPNNLNQYTSLDGSAVINGPEHEIQRYNNVAYYYVNDEHLKRVTSGNNAYDLFYDALGRCVKRVLNNATTYYIYDGEKPILEYRSTDLSNPAKNVYGKGIDEIVMRYDPSFNPAVTYYYQQDHEGSVTHLLNASGNVIESYKYDAFGAPVIYDANDTQRSSSAYSNRFQFTGREYANLFGFYEYRARAYHPTIGRFMSEDPKGFVRSAGLGAAPADWAFAAHPDEAEFNLFRYCSNDPIGFTDPMGLDAMANAVALAEAVVPGQYEYDQMVASLQSGNYGNAAGWGVAWVGSAVVGVVSGTTSTRFQAGLRAAETAAARRTVAGVIGKYLDSPNYVDVGRQLNKSVLNVPTKLWAKMNSGQKWAATQEFLDSLIAQKGDLLFNKSIKSIASQSGQFRQELEYASQKGYVLSQDGWSMTRAAEDAATAVSAVPLPSKP